MRLPDPATTGLAAAVRDLVALTRTLDAPPDVLAEATAAVTDLARRLERHANPGPYAQAGLAVDGVSPGAAGEKPSEYFPYSPVVGRLNPGSPLADFELVDDHMRGSVTFTPQFNGPPGLAHGGVIALVFDELLGCLLVSMHQGGFTGTLSVRYEKGTPLGVPIELDAWLDRSEGRKSFVKGEMRADGVVTARAEGIFIRSPGLPFGPGGT